MAFANIGKKTKSDKTPYKIFYPLNCNTLPPIKDIPAEGIQVVSIDIAIKNFAIRIERRYPNNVVMPIYFKREDFKKYGENTNETNGTAIYFFRLHHRNIINTQETHNQGLGVGVCVFLSTVCWLY